MSDSTQGRGVQPSSGNPWLGDGPLPPPPAPTHPPTVRGPVDPNVPVSPPAYGLPPTTPPPPPTPHTVGNESPDGPSKHSRGMAAAALVVALGLGMVVVGIVGLVGSDMFSTGGDPRPATEEAGSDTSSPTIDDTTTDDTTTDETGSEETSAVNANGLTPAQQRAADQAADELDWRPTSRDEVIDSLTSGYGPEQFSTDDATIGVDSLDIDWNEMALLSAESYLKYSAFSKPGLYDQLTSEYGEQFSDEQATYAVDNVDVDWAEQPARYAAEYVDLLAISHDALIDMMTWDYNGFTDDEATAAVDGLDVDWNDEAAEAAEEVIDDDEDINCDDLLDELTGSYRDFTPEQAQAGAEEVGVCDSTNDTPATDDTTGTDDTGDTTLTSDTTGTDDTTGTSGD